MDVWREAVYSYSAHSILTFCLQLRSLPSLLENVSLFLGVKWWLLLEFYIYSSLFCGCTVYVNQIKTQPRSSMPSLQDPALSFHSLMTTLAAAWRGCTISTWRTPFHWFMLICPITIFLKRSPDPCSRLGLYSGLNSVPSKIQRPNPQCDGIWRGN